MSRFRSPPLGSSGLDFIVAVIRAARASVDSVLAFSALFSAFLNFRPWSLALVSASSSPVAVCQERGNLGPVPADPPSDSTRLASSSS
ncbi:hypothetical protein, partial [Kitasatospora sp. NPDC093102]|uniref:hypothetical protein n=1 Tax=Kitasatospora sp. NPDC093102 TaxID=3155069 RepID=UPI00341FC8B6